MKHFWVLALVACSAPSLPPKPPLDGGAELTVVGEPRTAEAGSATAIVRLTLARSPDATVRVRAIASDPNEARVDPSELVIAAGASELVYDLSVVGRDDAIADGDRAYTIAVELASDDLAFDARYLTSPELHNADDDHPLDGIVELAVGDVFACARDATNAVSCWGSTRLGEPNFLAEDVAAAEPLDRTATRIVAGRAHACATDAAGVISCWGDDTSHQVGSTPAIAVRDLAAGGDSTCAQPMSGGIQCWGAVVHGSGAYAIAGTETAVAFDVASYYACAVLTDGTLRCWGLNGGTFGNGTSAAWTLEAVAGATTLTSLVDVAVDDNYSCVLDAAGAVYCTGSIGLDGTLGLSPVRIAGLPPLVSLSAGRVHACGLDAGGTVHCWGQNSLAKFAAQLPPAGNAIDVAAPLADASSVAAGGTRTCAIRRDGTARCWGDDQRGAGDGFPRARFVPGLPFADSVAAGSGGCAAGARGVWCWGANWWSQAGVGTQTVLETSPVRALADIRVRAMQRGGIDTTTSVATAAGALWYWGEELPTDEHESPRPPVELSANATFVDVAVGVGHGCALADDGHVWCWGENFSGQIGDGSLADTREPHMVAGLDGAVAIAAGFHSCALRTDGSVWCWGYGLGGALGPGGLDETNPSPIRVDVPPMIAIGAAWDYTCGLGKLGDLLCWGSNNPAPRSFGTFPGATRLHAGTRTACVETPTALECVAPRGIGVPRSQPLTGIVEVGLGDADSTSCAVLVSGETYCWGTREMLGAGRLAHAPKIVTGRWAR